MGNVSNMHFLFQVMIVVRSSEMCIQPVHLDYKEKQNKNNDFSKSQAGPDAGATKNWTTVPGEHFELGNKPACWEGSRNSEIPSKAV